MDKKPSTFRKSNFELSNKLHHKNTPALYLQTSNSFFIFSLWGHRAKNSVFNLRHWPWVKTAIEFFLYICLSKYLFLDCVSWMEFHRTKKKRLKYVDQRLSPPSNMGLLISEYSTFEEKMSWQVRHAIGRICLEL
jgi:hypothetical protein